MTADDVARVLQFQSIPETAAFMDAVTRLRASDVGLPAAQQAASDDARLSAAVIRALTAGVGGSGGEGAIGGAADCELAEFPMSYVRRCTRFDLGDTHVIGEGAFGKV